jgi:hypothetical protein
MGTAWERHGMCELAFTGSEILEGTISTRASDTLLIFSDM